MKKDILKKCIVLVAVLAMMLAVTACTVDPSDDGNDMETISVKINIDYPEADEQGEEIVQHDVMYHDIENFHMHVEKSATVMQILQSFADQEDIELLFDTDYVVSIGGLGADENSGWIYTVNGEEQLSKAATEYVAEDGDVITWKYVSFDDVSFDGE